MKQAVKGKKEKKGQLLQDRREEEDRLIDSFVRLDGDNQFLAACALTNGLKGREKRTKSKRGEGVSASDTQVDEDVSVDESLTVEELDAASHGTDDNDSASSEPARKKKRVKTTPDAAASYLVILNKDQHFTLIRQLVVAKEEYTPANPVQGKLMALANLGPDPGEDAPQLMVFEEQEPWRPVEVPRVDIENVTTYYAAEKRCRKPPR
jgi:hypothetical protein